MSGVTVSQRTSLVSLIPKDAGDKTRISDWRPISSLLCSDYKILARILVNRLRHLLAGILSQEQTGGLPSPAARWHTNSSICVN